jgi:hypothetical protein
MTEHVTADHWTITYDHVERRGTITHAARDDVPTFRVGHNGHAVFQIADAVPGATIHAVQVWLDRTFPAPDRLNGVMEIDHVIRVGDDGSVTDADGVYAPDVYEDDGELLPVGSGWSLLDGYSGQDRYSGPIMHASEYIGGRMASDILETPGLYVAVVVYPLDDSEPDGWAVAYRESEES